jgi:hypothetical protein
MITVSGGIFGVLNGWRVPPVWQIITAGDCRMRLHVPCRMDRKHNARHDNVILGGLQHQHHAVRTSIMLIRPSFKTISLQFALLALLRALLL